MTEVTQICTTMAEALWGPVRCECLVEGGGIVLQATSDLWDIEGDATHAGGDGLVVVVVGVA